MNSSECAVYMIQHAFKLIRNNNELMFFLCNEQDERFHQDIATMEKRYQGKSTVNMQADYC